jgi:hypothetical protein
LEQQKMLQEYSQAAKPGAPKSALQAWARTYGKYRAKLSPQGSVLVDLMLSKDGTPPTKSPQGGGVIYVSAECKQQCFPIAKGILEGSGVVYTCTNLVSCLYNKDTKQWICKYDQCTVEIAQ